MAAELAREFGKLWQSNTTPPDVFFFLAQQNGIDAAQQLAVALEDQKRRWQTDSPLTVEDYLTNLPDLAADPRIKLELAVGEYQARQNGGTSPSIDEFTSRFGDISDTLRSRLSELSGDVAFSTTQTFTTETVSGRQIGRYRVVRHLGEGAFGRVWLAEDQELQRRVAIKEPKPDRFQKPEDAEAYLTEARTVAKLDHPHIVPVYDMGRTEAGSVYVVSKFITGQTLEDRIKQDRLSPEVTADIMATVASALQHAHDHRLIHRDLKPANILLEEDTTTPYVTDFGLAVKEGDFLAEGLVAGTPAYMSPEQARGEGHRLDGRSDIFSLGVVLYELLTGKKPFRGSTAHELIVQITSTEPRPPRELDESVPVELERICLKSLSKRASDRYAKADELADDLLSWQQGPEQQAKSHQIVPKGLRSFDANDADFFLELLPGPRNRLGLPDSIQFWKTGIEETDPDETFTVGLIYGPSGCGKSSMVKAGLLTRLSKNVVAVYVEATPEETETRILRGLRKQLPKLSESLGLVETLTLLRRSEGPKVVIVLDQFEQWLHTHRLEQTNELVSALRQCDGGNLQALVMVRDDFWLAASRFMNTVEVDLIQGQNIALVDLFDEDHARKVLIKFGQAFGKLPNQTSQLTEHEQDFVGSVVSGLARDGQIVCVRLALFAEMVKGKPWRVETLEKVGGTEGIGINFLEETFSSRAASPKHRLHQQAARNVLRALLPEAGSDIRGHMRSHDELLATSSYQNHPNDFEDLLRILDGELRLITPTDPEGFQSEISSDPDAKYFQLTHDYLVPSLREWLTRKQQETRKGRAELKLAERAALWNAKPENRHLPSWWEWANIRALTEKNNWSEPEQRLLARAGRVHGVRGSLLLLLFFVLTFAGLHVRGRVVEANNQEKAAGWVKALVRAEIEQVPGIIDELKMYRQWADPLLAEQMEQYGDQSKERLNLALASVPYDDVELAYLKNRLLSAPPEHVETICLLLEDGKENLLDELWQLAETSSQTEQKQLLQIASFLAIYDASNDARWEKIADRVVEKLMQENSLRAAVWMKTLRPARSQLLNPLAVVFRSNTEDRSQRQIDLATDVLEDYAAEDLNTLADLLFDAEPKQFVALYDEFAAYGNQALELLNRELAKEPRHIWNDVPLDPSWTEPAPNVVNRIREAHGTIGDRFAFCQTMKLDDFLTVAEQLRPSGFRPIRLRPFSHSDAVRVAAVWTRDGRVFRLLVDQSLSAIQRANEDQRNQGFMLSDAAGYLANAGKQNNERYAAIWCKNRESIEWAVYFGMQEDSHSNYWLPLRDRNFSPASRQIFLDSENLHRHTVIWQQPARKDWFFWNGDQEFYESKIGSGIQRDVDLGRAAEPQTQGRYEQSLTAVEAKLQEEPDDLSSRYARGEALFYLGRDEQALEDLNYLVEKTTDPNFIGYYVYRAMLYARQGKVEEAKEDLAKFQKLSQSANQKVYLDAVVSAYLGEEAEAMKRLAVFVEEKKTDSGALYDAACAYSMASKAVQEKDAAKSKVYSDRAVALIRQAVEHGYSDYSHMQEDADLDPIREHSGFQEIMHGGNLDVRYSGVWNSSNEFESTELHGLSPAEHLEKCHELHFQNYRMVSISTAPINGKLVTASVWHRPVVSEMEKESLARRQANAAVAAFRMDQASKVWPLLKHSPDPRLRTWIIHRLSSLEASPESLVTQIKEESDVTIRRALILALGECSEHPAIDREELTSHFLDWYRHDPDAGIHGATEWVLRRWGHQEELEAIDANLTTGKTEGERQWYLTKTNRHTMTLFPGPVEFSMGSPETEPHRHSSELRHRRKIGRSFALSTKEVTVAQFRHFTKELEIAFSFSKKHASKDGCPQTDLSWYQAAKYCRWLSEQEGIPDDQMCYPPIPEVKGGMTLPNNFLERTGYRLPTEAEWEYACRAGTTTSRFYGMADELLTNYARILENAEDRSWPVASLKPNDRGLFDMYGNVREWTNFGKISYSTGRISEDTEPGLKVEDKTRRILRGDSFLDRTEFARSADRGYSAVPTHRSSTYGFRPAKTYHLSP